MIAQKSLDVNTINRWKEYNNVPLQAIAAIMGVSVFMVSKQLTGEREIQPRQALKLWAHMQRYKYTGVESAPSIT